MISLHLHRGVLRHAVVAQVVEAKFAGGSVGDVLFIHLPAEFARLVVLNTTNGEAEPVKEVSHPFGVASSEVIVHSDDVDSHAGESVEKNRKSSDEGFTLTGGHLSDHATVQTDATDELDVEVHHLPLDRVIADVPLLTAEPAGGIFHDGVCLWENLIQIGSTRLGELLLQVCECLLGFKNIFDQRIIVESCKRIGREPFCLSILVSQFFKSLCPGSQRFAVFVSGTTPQNPVAE